MAGDIIRIRPGLKCRLELSVLISKLERSDAYKQPLRDPSCLHTDPPGLVTRTFRFVGKGRDVTIDVTLHAKAMVGLLKAIRARRTIQVTQSSSSKYSGSYRTWAQQYELWYAWAHRLPDSHKAANPCYGFHRCGRAFDLYLVTDAEAEAVLDVRVDGLRFYWGKAFGDNPHFTLGELG